MVRAFGYITSYPSSITTYPSSIPLPTLKEGGREGRRGGGLLICKLFQSLQVFIHNYYKFLSFSTKLMIFQVSTSLGR